METDIPSLHALAMRGNCDVTWMPVCDPGEDMPPPPHFAFGARAEKLLTDYYSETYRGSAGLYVAANLGLFERALLFHGETVLRCEKIGVTRANVSKFLPFYRAMTGLIRIRKESGRCVLLLGRGYHVWGHWLIDFLPKLHLLRLAGYDLGELKYLVPDDTPGFGLEILDLAGITEERRVVYNHQFEQVYPEELLIPTLVRTGDRPTFVFADAVRFATSLIRDRLPDPETRHAGKIFVSRGRLNTNARRMLNRERIERIATDAGFGIVHPETMPLRVQFALFSGARHIVGDYGSALHTSIFSDSTTMVCALRGTAALPDLVQSAIGEALGQPTGYVFGDMIAGDRSESFSISEAAFERYLDLVHHDKAQPSRRPDDRRHPVG